MQVIEAGLSAKGKKFAIVVARFNSFIVESLLESLACDILVYLNCKEKGRI